MIGLVLVVILLVCGSQSCSYITAADVAINATITVPAPAAAVIACQCFYFILLLLLFFLLHLISGFSIQ